MNVDLWRKSSQWFSLTRSHAELLAQEDILAPKFDQYCNGYREGNFCVPDEHYIPTALAFYGLESEVSLAFNDVAFIIHFRQTVWDL